MIRLLVAMLLLAAFGPLDAQERRERSDRSFSWKGTISEGRWLRLHNINGAIDVTAGEGNTTIVQAEKRWRRGDPRDVRVEVLKDGGDVVICALWDEDDRCDEDGYHSGRDNDDDDDSDVSMHFTVKLPKGVKVDANTVNGAIDVRGAGGQVLARTVNGRIDAASSAGPVEANTVNGAIHARMGAIEGAGDLTFTTVNGSVTVEVPGRLDAEVEMQTLNGELRTDFPLTVSGRFNPRRIRATVGKGGRQLRLKTVNGSVELRKRDQG